MTSDQYPPIVDKLIKDRLRVQGEDLAERAPINTMILAKTKGLAAALATSCFNMKDGTLIYVIYVGNCFER